MEEPRGTCEICGKPLPPGRRRYCSEACSREKERMRAKEARKDRLRPKPYRWITCPDCGKQVWRPIKSIRCQQCQAELNKRHDAEHKARKSAGRSRKIGDQYPCEACGKMYVLEGGKQRYCPDCRETQVRANIRRMNREWNRAVYGTEEGKAKRAEARSLKAVPNLRACAQCGKPYETLTCGIYCSKECQAKGQQAYQKEYSNKNKEKIRERWKKRQAEMTPEQREERNRRARENYAKRKERANEVVEKESQAEGKPAEREKTQTANREGIWALRRPDGEVVMTKNISKFVRDHPEDFPNANNAILGIKRMLYTILNAPKKPHNYQYKGWTLLDHSEYHDEIVAWREERAKKGAVRWTLESPDGEIVETDNLKEFIALRPEEFPDVEKAMYGFWAVVSTLRGGMTSCKKYQYKGWRVIDRSDCHDEIVAQRKAQGGEPHILRSPNFQDEGTWTLKSPSGEIIKTDNLKAYIRSHQEAFPDTENAINIIRRTLYTMIGRKTKVRNYQYRGWTVVDHSKYHDEIQAFYALQQKNCVWTLQSPGGEIVETANLTAYINSHPEAFAKPDTARSCFDEILKTLIGQRKYQPIYQYKGWRVIDRSDYHDEIMIRREQGKTKPNYGKGVKKDRKWILEDPEGNIYHVDGLRAFVMAHPEEFPNRDSACSQFSLIRRNIGEDGKTVKDYKGWRVIIERE